MNHRARILLVAPHSDDELYGAGGSLLKWKSEGAQIRIVLVACSTIKLRHNEETTTAGERLAEFFRSAEFLSTVRPSVYHLRDTGLDLLPLSALVSRLDDEIEDFGPSLFLLPDASYHQDHQFVHRACIAALRPTGGHSPGRVLEYEVPTSTWHGPGQSFEPTTYSDISAYLENKIDVFKACYPSQYTEQARGRLAESGIRQHALYRGIESGVTAAEAFRLLREVV